MADLFCGGTRGRVWTLMLLFISTCWAKFWKKTGEMTMGNYHRFLLGLVFLVFPSWTVGKQLWREIVPPGGFPNLFPFPYISKNLKI